MPIIDTIPPGFTDRLVAEDWRDRPRNDDYYYPEGVTGTTRVAVVIRHAGVSTLHEGCAQSFGWHLRPAMPSCAGLDPSDAPITHYKILDR